MDLITVDDENGDNFDIGGFFYTDAEPISVPGVGGDPSSSTTSSTTNNAEPVVEIGGLSEHDEIADAFENYKIISELRPTDVYVLQKMRNAVIVPTYTIKEESGRKIGAPVLVEGTNAKDYSANLNTIARGCFPAGSTERALEVIY